AQEGQGANAAFARSSAPLAPAAPQASLHGSAHAQSFATVQAQTSRAPQAPAAEADFAALAQRLSGNSLQFAQPTSDVNEELRTLRRMLETQLATLAWNDLSRRAPVQTE